MNDLQLLIDAAQEAGRIATRFAKNGGAEIWDKPDGQGPVTQADLAVNEMLSAELQRARPTYGWLSEETDDNQQRLEHDQVFIIDPIDGTRSFINGETTWAHSLAIARGGQIESAVVYLPLRNKLYTAQAGGGAMLNGQPIRATRPDQLNGSTVLAAKPNLDPAMWRGRDVPALKRHYRPSLAYRLSLVAEGRFDAMITLRNSWEWDIAAGDLILREAGATVSDVQGHPLRFNNPRPQVRGVVAAGAPLHGQLAGRLLHLPE